MNGAQTSRHEPRTSTPPSKVVVTGMGAVSACGIGVEALWNAVIPGRGMARWFHSSCGDDRWPACPVQGDRFDGDDHPAMRRQDRHVRMGVAAARQSVLQARVLNAGINPQRIGIVWGTSRGPIGVWDRMWDDWRGGGRSRPTLMPAGTVAAASGAISVVLGARGPVLSVSAACASGAHAIADAARLILCGEADVVVAGASDSVLIPIALAQFESAGLLAHALDPASACRPFDQERNGTVFGEGAGAVVLESASHAKGRGVEALAVLAGWGLTADGVARIDPDPRGVGIERAIRIALRMADLRPESVGYANLHGTGTLANDAAEASAMSRVFGAAQPMCGSTKGCTGHCVGAGAAIEAIIAILALRESTAPPSANLFKPAYHLRFPIAHPARFTAPATLSTSAGFWGLNACLVLTHPGPLPHRSTSTP